MSKSYLTRCAIWYYLYKLKNVKNIHGGVLLSVNLWLVDTGVNFEVGWKIQQFFADVINA